MIQSPQADVKDFLPSLACLVEPVLAELCDELGAVAGLGAAERGVIRDGAAAGMYEAAHRKLCRMLVLELNAARTGGLLDAADSAARWSQFIEMSSSRAYWESLIVHYPTMLARTDVMLRNRRTAALALGRRLAADRGVLGAFAASEHELGELVAASFGAGDSHRGGHSVVLLRFEGGRVAYKPRSVAVDHVLDGFLEAVFTGERIRVPRVVFGAEYGWAEHVEHRYCTDSAQLARFYGGLGEWLAVMRLLGGSDLHAENVIADGPIPVVVDCETLFTPVLPAPPTGLGLAVDRAVQLIEGTVLRTGILPSRGVALGWRGVDTSAAGSLPGQQPVGQRPVLLGGGTDLARIGSEPAAIDGVVASHPSREPSLAEYWHHVLDGFGSATERLRALDRDGALEPLVRRFGPCPVRVVLRGTEAYAEIARMLWHPVSLHEPEAAAARASGLMAKMAQSLPGAPSDPRIIEAEVQELLIGDVPYFAGPPELGRLTGPGGFDWLDQTDLIADTLTRWRGADMELDRHVIRAAVVTAYLNEGARSGHKQMSSGEVSTADLDARRRIQAARLLETVRDKALHAEDGTVTWIAPVLDFSGWALLPLGQDLYGGLAGVAVLLAAYQRETAAGRADAVDGVDALLAATLGSMRAAEDYAARNRESELHLRPAPPGAYLGIGSQIWSWLVLHGFGAAPDGIDRAAALADDVLALAITEDEEHDLLLGSAGAIVPLLQLAAASGDKRRVDQAREIGDRLCAEAVRQDGRAYWASSRWQQGMGGFAHGVTGIGWALARLALETGVDEYGETARAAFAFEESLWSEEHAGWIDLRERESVETVAAWCHGAVGIGLAAADLAARGWPEPERPVLDRAAAAVAQRGFGWNHTLCHGDFGAWELLDVALAGGQADPQLTRELLDARVIGSLEMNGPISGMARDVFSPSLVGGLGGVAYQLLCMGCHNTLPSPLTLGKPGESRYS